MLKRKGMQCHSMLTKSCSPKAQISGVAMSVPVAHVAHVNRQGQAELVLALWASLLYCHMSPAHDKYSGLLL